MLFFILILVISTVYGGKLPDTHKYGIQNSNNTNATTAITREPKIQATNVTNINIASEGGPIVTPATVLTLQNNNSVQTLLNLDKEFGSSKEKPSVPRKSAPTEAPALVTDNNTTVQGVLKNDTVSKVSSNITQASPRTTTTPVTTKPNSDIAVSSRTNSSTVEHKHKNITTTKAPIMKPTITSYEQLLHADNNQTQLRIIFNDKGTTTTTFVSSTTKVISNKDRNTTSHPGMVMPLVITVLVVPVFAVLGYMALKRGQEAWKNRHYKRMDFLLDGMYND